MQNTLSGVQEKLVWAATLAKKSLEIWDLETREILLNSYKNDSRHSTAKISFDDSFDPSHLISHLIL